MSRAWRSQSPSVMRHLFCWPLRTTGTGRLTSTTNVQMNSCHPNEAKTTQLSQTFCQNATATNKRRVRTNNQSWKGWNNAGIKRFDLLCKLVKKNRKEKRSIDRKVHKAMDPDAAQGKEPKWKQRKTLEQLTKACVDGDDSSDVDSNESEISDSEQPCKLTSNVMVSCKAASGMNRKTRPHLQAVNSRFNHCEHVECFDGVMFAVHIVFLLNLLKGSCNL